MFIRCINSRKIMTQRNISFQSIILPNDAKRRFDYKCKVNVALLLRLRYTTFSYINLIKSNGKSKCFQEILGIKLTNRRDENNFLLKFHFRKFPYNSNVITIFALLIILILSAVVIIFCFPSLYFDWTLTYPQHWTSNNKTLIL